MDKSFSLIKKYLFLAIFILVGLTLIFYSIQAIKKPVKIQEEHAAEPSGPVLVISPGSVGTRPNTSFDLNLNIDAKEERVTAADVTVSFDPNLVRLDSISKGDFLPVILKQGSYSNGIFKIVLGCDPYNPKSGSGTLATLHFTTLSEGRSRINFTSESQIAVVGQNNNALSSFSGMTLSVSNPITNKPSPSPIVTPSSAPTPTLTTTSIPTPTSWIPTNTPVVTQVIIPTALPTMTLIPKPTDNQIIRKGSIIRVYAAGTSYANVYPNMQLLVDDHVVLEAFNVKGNPYTRMFSVYTYESPEKLSPSQIKVAFINDKSRRNLIVSKINIDGIDYQTESRSVYTKYQDRSGCRSGYRRSEWLYCNGSFNY